jgi:hypothetical protein
MSEESIEYSARALTKLSALPSWDSLPDIGLYMDQVITYMERVLIPFHFEEKGKHVTPSMINNYAKASIIPRTKGKKYSREHIATLLAAFTLKRVLSIQDIATLLGGFTKSEDVQAFYERFRSDMKVSVQESENKQDIEKAIESSSLTSIALRYAVDSSLKSLIAEDLIQLAGRLGEPKKTKVRS